jgi:CBS domain-containing protein
MSAYRISPVPVIVGTLLWGAATALLLEDALHSGRYDVATMATPILTAATVAAACLCHARLRDWRILGAAGFLLLALLGSAVMVSGTLGRLAEAKDGKEATVQAVNRTYGEKQDALTEAKAAAKRECVKRGPVCTGWQQRIDQLTAELSAIVVRSSDPKADAIARLVSLVGGNGERAKAIVAAIDPVTLPLFLELGSVLFFGAAFGHRPRSNAIERNRDAIVEQPSVLNQLELAKVWGVHPSTASRRLRKLEAAGQVRRHRDGRSVLALPAPR